MNPIISNKTISYQLMPGLLSKTILRPPMSIEEITSEVCRSFLIEPEDLIKRSRKANLVAARHIIFYIATRRIVPKYTYDRVGRNFGIDHATVIYGSKRVEELMQYDKDFQYRVFLIIQALGL